MYVGGTRKLYGNSLFSTQLSCEPKTMVKKKCLLIEKRVSMFQISFQHLISTLQTSWAPMRYSDPMMEI